MLMSEEEVVRIATTAAKYVSGIRGVDYRELLGAAWQGAITGLDRWDPNKARTSLERWVWYAAYQSILNYLHRCHPIGVRTFRLRRQKYARTLSLTAKMIHSSMSHCYLEDTGFTEVDNRDEILHLKIIAIRHMKRLRPGLQPIFMLYLEGLTSVEIANLLGIGKRSVRTMIGIARKQIRKTIEQETK